MSECNVFNIGGKKRTVRLMFIRFLPISHAARVEVGTAALLLTVPSFLAGREHLQ